LHSLFGVCLGAVLLVTPGLDARQAPAGQPAAASAPGPFDRLEFRNIGPATPSGRIDDFAVLESNPAVFYIGTATGGVWKTENNGTTLTPVFDNEATGSVGDVAIAPTDANLVWVGTGENNNRQSSSWGEGVYKSADGGRTWRHMGLRNSKHIARIIVDLVDFNVVYVAALGDLWAAGGDRGVYKTTDGGTTWQRTLFVDQDTGATELVMDPSNNKVLYAATYQRRRQPWGMNGGGPGSAIWKSTDAGQTWTKLEQGLPAGPKGRIGLDVWRKDPNVVYARIEHETESGVYRSDDAGASWRKMSDTNPRPMYFSQIRIDPTTDSRIYVLGVSLYISDDAGKTFRSDGAENIHVDHHAMWIDPNNPKHLIIGNDGGVSISYDAAKTWVWLNNLPVGQPYHVTYDMQVPYHVCAGFQDNNTWCGPSAVRTTTGIINDDWYVINGGDGFQPLMDPTDARIVYGESQDGRMSRIDRTTNERTTIRPEVADGEPELRWNWDTAMMLSPHDPKTIYVGANRLYRSPDRGHSWQAISPDLTTNTDREALSIMGVTGDKIAIAKHDGVSSFSNLVTIGESPLKAGLLWTGSDDGVVSVSRDAGANWANVSANVPGVPKFTYVSKVAPSRFAEGTVYATFDGHRGGDYKTYVFTSTDYGASWRSIAGNLPAGEVARTITEDLKNADVLYLGTETGVWVSLDRGRQWTRVKANLPTVPVYEITLHPRDNDMLLATHGRGVWILDDLTPFQQWAKAQSAGTFVFDPAPATAFNPANDQMKRFEGDRIFLAPNPAAGVALTYRLGADAKDAKWTIRDAGNAVVREIAGRAMRDHLRSGLNTVQWDLRVQPLEPLRGQQGGGGGGGFGGGGNNGPFVLPGAYKATLTVDGRDANVVTVTVGGDPAIAISEADRKTWHDTAMTLHGMQRTANAAADAVSQAWSQFQSVQEMTKGRDIPAALKTRLDDLGKELGDLRERLGLAGGGFGNTRNVRGRIGQVKNQVMGSTALPTETQMAVMKELQAALPALVTDANTATAKVAPLVKDFADGGVVPAPIRPVPPPGR
ncbi:MAG: WD40/YVTN/BNR-like repeat-containing protein, partial [Vicinamibacterales bacterium]